MILTRVIASASLAVALCGPLSAGQEAAVEKKRRTDWFQQAGWGVFTHYLTGPEMSAQEWNARVNGFDVKGERSGTWVTL